MAVKGFYDNPQEATVPANSDLLGIQTGTTLADMKKITYENLVKPLETGKLDKITVPTENAIVTQNADGTLKNSEVNITDPTFDSVGADEFDTGSQVVQAVMIPSTDDEMLKLLNTQAGKVHTIMELRSPDTGDTEATLSLHTVPNGIDDWVCDLSFHNYSTLMKFVSVISHFTGENAGSWEWVSRYTDGTDYSMIERMLMKLDGQTGYLLVGESGEATARIHVKQSGYLDKPAVLAEVDSSHTTQPEALQAKNDTNFAHTTNLVKFKLMNATDTGVVLKLENAGTGDYINADGKFVVDKDGNVDSPTIDAIETALTTLNADDTTEGSVAKAVKDTAQDATYDNTGTGIEATTLKTAITELDARLVDAEAHVYGLDFNETTGVCTRLLDAVGLTVGAPDGVNPIASDFDSCYPWSAMHHVKIALDGTRKEPFEDGYDAFDGEMMRHTPAYWYKDYRSGGHRYLYISDKKKAGFLYQKAYDIASFDASKVGTSYRSRVGETPKTNESYTQFITGFYAQGDGKWSMYDQLHSEFMLSVIEAGTLNHKAAYGRGINSAMPYGSGNEYKLTADTVNGNDVVLADSAQPFYVGMTVQIGTTYTNNSVAQDRIITNVVRAGGVLTLTLDDAPFSAVIGNSCVTWGQSVPQEQFDAIGDGSGYILQYANANRSHVCYRGVWDLWGNVWQFYAGFMRYNGRYYGCTDPTKYKITNPVGADGWIDLGIGEYAENGYQQIREGVVIDGGTIDVPITWGSVASSETYYSAYLYNFNSTYSGVRVLLLGGNWDNGGNVSLVFSYGDYSPSHSIFNVGSRLIRS